MNSIGDTFSPCLWYKYVVTSVVGWGGAYVPTLLAMEVSCALLLRGLVHEDFCPWRGHGGPVVVKRPI